MQIFAKKPRLSYFDIHGSNFFILSFLVSSLVSIIRIYMDYIVHDFYFNKMAFLKMFIIVEAMLDRL